MELEALLQIADSSTTVLLAVLVWSELRKVREEIVAVLHRIDGYISAEKSE